MAPFNPFTKPIREIGASDLATLRTIPEGWYIEYKRELPSAISAAKSLCAFANSYGGWIFYGIEEDTNGERTAGAFPGISRASVSNVEQLFRQAAATQISPSPAF